MSSKLKTTMAMMIMCAPVYIAMVIITSFVVQTGNLLLCASFECAAIIFFWDVPLFYKFMRINEEEIYEEDAD